MSDSSEVREFFDTYVRHFNDALEGRPDFEAMAAQYTSPFMAAGPQGVSAADNDETFLGVLRQGSAAYLALGMRSMTVRAVEATPIDDTHTMAKVFYRASYVRPSDQEPIEIDFDVTYLLERRERWRVFAFIAGDEQALHEEYGLVPNAT